MPPEEGLARRWGTNKKDHFEGRVVDLLDFHQRVRDGFLKLAANDPQRWLVVDASQSKAKIGEIIWRRVSQLLSRQGD